MEFTIDRVAFRVEAREILTSNDPDDTGFLDTKNRVIELLRGQPMESAVLSLSREVCRGWLHARETPRTQDKLLDFNEELLVQFFDEFSRQGGRAQLAAVMGVPFEGDVAGLDALPWDELPFHKKRHFIIRSTICAGLTHAQFEVFLARCDAAGLDPLRGDCWPAKVYDPQRKVMRIECRSTIKSIRRLARASDRFAGVTAQQFSAKGGEWLDVWPDDENPPFAARCGVYTKGIERPEYFVAHWREFAQYFDPGDGREPVLEYHWRIRGTHMLGKCAEAGAYARVIPECDGLYLAEHVDAGRPVSPDAARAIERRSRCGPGLPSLDGFGSADAVINASEKDGPAAADAREVDGDNRGEGGDTRWIRAIRNAGRAATAEEAYALLEEIREECRRAENGDFEDLNPEGFEKLLSEQARRKFGRRR